jgi:hypothetical protein
VTDDATSMSELLDPAAAPGAAPRAAWEFLEILATVILAAESLRVVGSLASGIIFGATAHVGPFGNQRLVGSAVVRAVSFSDGPGLVLLLLSFALLWWRAEYWTNRVDPPAGAGNRPPGAAVVQLRRLGGLARWAMILFALVAAGALAFLVGNILVNTAGGVPTNDRWEAYASDSFSVAYLVIASAGLVASLRLAELCRVDAAQDAAADAG